MKFKLTGRTLVIGKKEVYEWLHIEMRGEIPTSSEEERH